MDKLLCGCQPLNGLEQRESTRCPMKPEGRKETNVKMGWQRRGEQSAATGWTATLFVVEIKDTNFNEFVMVEYLHSHKSDFPFSVSVRSA